MDTGELRKVLERYWTDYQNDHLEDSILGEYMFWFALDVIKTDGGEPVEEAYSIFKEYEDRFDSIASPVARWISAIIILLILQHGMRMLDIENHSRGNFNRDWEEYMGIKPL